MLEFLSAERNSSREWVGIVSMRGVISLFTSSRDHSNITTRQPLSTVKAHKHSKKIHFRCDWMTKFSPHWHWLLRETELWLGWRFRCKSFTRLGLRSQPIELTSSHRHNASVQNIFYLINHNVQSPFNLFSVFFFFLLLRDSIDSFRGNSSYTASARSNNKKIISKRNKHRQQWHDVVV